MNKTKIYKENSFLYEIIARNEEIAKIGTNLDYINWLKMFTQKHPNFGFNDWSYDQEDLTAEDLMNVRKLDLFYETVEEYATENQIDATFDKDFNSGYHYLLKHNGHGFIIGFFSGQGTNFYCGRINAFENAIDFDDVVKYHTKRKSRIRKKTI